MKARSLIILVFFVLISTSGIFAQSAPKYSNEFLSIGISARSMAMGNATIASSNDVTAAYWNPANLTYIPYDLELGVMHASYFAGLAAYDYLGGVARIDDKSAFGISIIRFGVDDIPNTLELIDNDGNIRYDRIKSFSVADWAFLFSYAKLSNTEGLRYGGNVKVIRRVAGDFAGAWGFGFDLSARYDKGNWLFAAMARDVTSTFNAWSFNTSELEEVFIVTGNEIPDNSLEITLPKLMLGVGRKIDISEKFTGLVEIDADMTFDGKRNVLIKGDPVSIDPHMGFEIGFRNILFFRGGVSNFQQVPDFDNKNSMTFQPNLGLGIKIKQLSIDYALTDIGDQSIALYSNVFSIRYGINRK